MSKSSRKGKKHTNDSRQNSAKEAFVKRLKNPKARASKAQLTELTTELNTRFAEVQALSHTPTVSRLLVRCNTNSAYVGIF